MNGLRAKKGIALVMAIFTVLIVVGIAVTVLSLVTSQSRLVRHQINRIKAYYAARAGAYYSIYQLRSGVWVAPTSSTWSTAESGLPYNVTINVFAKGGAITVGGHSSKAPTLPNVSGITAYVNYE